MNTLITQLMSMAAVLTITLSTLPLQAQEQPQMRQAAPAQMQKKEVTQPMRAAPARPQFSTERMMQRLRAKPLRATAKPAGAGSNRQVAAPRVTPKYEIADCGSKTNPAICCSYKSGDEGSTCELFKLLCENAGGTAKGGEGAATCTDW